MNGHERIPHTRDEAEVRGHQQIEAGLAEAEVDTLIKKANSLLDEGKPELAEVVNMQAESAIADGKKEHMLTPEAQIRFDVEMDELKHKREAQEPQ